VTDANIRLTYSNQGGPYNTLANPTSETENNAAPDDLVCVNLEVQNTSITEPLGLCSTAVYAAQ
jgi:hypothetical protein